MGMTVGSVPGSDGLAAAHEALQSARLPRASGPGPEPGALRNAYLELLKLSVCDLAGTTTVSVGRNEDGVAASRELAGEQLRLRTAGMDWPLQGLSMVGLDRLDDLQRCVESVVRDSVDGDLIEAGTWRGGAAIVIRATCDSLGETDRTLVVADSFQGFPSVERPEDQWEGIDYLAVPLEEVKANFTRLGLERGVEFAAGFFADTLPALADRRWSLIRLDGDTYGATRAGLEALYPGLSTGGYLIVDDYGALQECRAAVDEFRSTHGIEEPLEQVDWTCVRWRRETERSGLEPGCVDRPGQGQHRGAAPPAPPRSSAPPRRAKARIPSLHELALERELEALRAQLQAAQIELQRLPTTPLRSLRTRVGWELGRKRRT